MTPIQHQEGRGALERAAWHLFYADHEGSAAEVLEMAWADPRHFDFKGKYTRLARACLSALIPPSEETIIAVAKAQFLAEHPGAEWSAGRVRALWFTRAESAIEGLVNSILREKA